MPRLNRAGLSTTGYGRSWWDEQSTVYQDCTSGTCEIRLSSGALISTRGNIMHLEARDGRWAAQDAAGVYGSWGEIPGAALMGGPAPYASQLIGPDGSLIYKKIYHSRGPWRIRYVDGRDEEVIPGDGWAFQNLGAGKAIWLDMGNVLHGRSVGGPQVTCYSIRWAEGHLLRQDAVTGELVLDGHVVAPAADYHRPDLLIRPDGSYLIVWSPDAGESQVRTLTLTPAELPRVGVPQPAPTPTPTPIPEPVPMSLIAPNEIDTVRRVMREHPEINTLDESQRGAILDYAAASLNAGRPGPWGRKSRNPLGTDLNTDGLTFSRPDGRFEIYDAIDGTSGTATWEGYGPFRQGENGYWVPALPVTGAPQPPTDATHKYDGGGNDTGTCDRCGRARADAVHATPASKVVHAYDGGEQDTGLCDVCGQTREGSLHGVALPLPEPKPAPVPPTPPPPPVPNPVFADLLARVKLLEAACTRLAARVGHLEATTLKTGRAVSLTGRTGRAYGHAHDVTVTGTL